MTRCLWLWQVKKRYIAEWRRGVEIESCVSEIESCLSRQVSVFATWAWCLFPVKYLQHSILSNICVCVSLSFQHACVSFELHVEFRISSVSNIQMSRTSYSPTIRIEMFLCGTMIKLFRSLRGDWWYKSSHFEGRTPILYKRMYSWCLRQCKGDV